MHQEGAALGRLCDFHPDLLAAALCGFIEDLKRKQYWEDRAGTGSSDNVQVRQQSQPRACTH